MLYRDYMQKFRPLMGPDGPAGGEGGEAAAAAGQQAAPSSDASSAAPAAGEAAAAAPAAGADAVTAEAPAAAAPEAQPESQPSLLEAATGKPKPEVEAKPDADALKPDPAKDAPAPADAAKTEGDDKPKPEGDKPEGEADKSKPEGDKAAEATDPAKDATAEAPPPAPIKYEAFKLPEGVTLDQERIGKFTEIAGPAQVAQDVAQNLLNLHVEEIAKVQQAAIDNQRKVWNTYIDTITNELRKDPELGGNRLETSLSMAKAVVEEYLPANEASEYLALLTHNGMGNHRLQVKLLHEIGRKLNIFEDGLVPANPQAPKAQKSPGNRGWYDKTPGGAAAS